MLVIALPVVLCQVHLQLQLLRWKRRIVVGLAGTGDTIDRSPSQGRSRFGLSFHRRPRDRSHICSLLTLLRFEWKNTVSSTRTRTGWRLYTGNRRNIDLKYCTTLHLLKIWDHSPSVSSCSPESEEQIEGGLQIGGHLRSEQWYMCSCRHRRELSVDLLQIQAYCKR
jgi:hypothetical protein